MGQGESSGGDGGAQGHYRVGVDIGGTFTDLIVVDDDTGAFAVGKVLTTPDDPSRAVEVVLVETLQAASIPVREVRHLVHGTTLVTNAIIERKGALTALLTSAGFRDAVEIGREHRYDLYDLQLELPRPLVPRYLRFDVPERTLADGATAQALDVAFVERLARELEASGVTAVAITFLHGYAYPAAERSARAAVRRAAPGLRVSLSSEVVPELREYERTSTTIANVYVQAMVEQYLHELQERLQRLRFRGRFFVMLSSGGIATADTAARFPIRLIESGPAGGAIAAAAAGEASNQPDLLSFDMGGTTAKLCIVDSGQPLITHDFEVAHLYRFKRGSGLPIRVPVIEMIEIGVGGGSIARVDALGLLKVGPDSAGAAPGPACYGLGGSAATVTDASLILGYLDPGYFLGGRMQLDVAAARRAIKEQVADRLGIGVEDAAYGIYRVVNENMANAARAHGVERGKDLRSFPIFAFGGAGPMHAFAIGRLLGTPAVIVPPGAGVISAAGFLAAPLSFDFVRSWYARLDALDWERAAALYREMEAEGQDLLMSSGVPEAAITHTRTADMRYVGQGHTISVPLPPGTLSAAMATAIDAAFDQAYRALYSRAGPPVPIEVINWRVVSAGPRPAFALRASDAAPDQLDALKGYRPAHFAERGGYLDTPVFDRYRLPAGTALDGPAIIEERESTTILGPGGRATVTADRNLVISVVESLKEDLR
jgi:N-methylhydantoinase A